jgi:hypothetical protein
MQNQKVVIETVGSIIKKEDLVIFENPNHIMAFETAHAYPGYNGIVPQNYDPNSVFLITKERYLTEDIFMVSQKIKQTVGFDFNAAIAQVEFQKKHFPAIRIKDLKNYSFIPELISKYVEEGIHFEKTKSTKDFNTLIQVTKGFMIDPCEDGYYKDMLDGQMNYFEIPKMLAWEQFEKIVVDIKYNHPELNFDAALSLFYRATRVVFAVRIFKAGWSIEEMKFLKEQFFRWL